MMENTLFSHVAEIYSKARPNYPEQYIESIPSQQNIVEFGAGTGKLTEQILSGRAPKSYLAIEPNLEMSEGLKELTKEYANFHFLLESAEDSSAPDKSADLIVVAQAFHWFDGEAFLREVKRILKDDGKVQLIWNRRENTPVNEACKEIFETYCPDFKGFGGGIWDNFSMIENFFASTGFKETIYDYPFLYSKEQFIARNLTGSYIPSSDLPVYHEIVAALEKVYASHKNNDETIVMGNATVVYENLKSFI